VACCIACLFYLSTSGAPRGSLNHSFLLLVDILPAVPLAASLVCITCRSLYLSMTCPPHRWLYCMFVFACRRLPRCPAQTRDHLFKEFAEWRGQQKTRWAEIRKETGRGKSGWKVQDLLADERCSRAVLDFRATTDVGRRVPARAEEDAQSEASAWEL
jgi:hypothetical protein